MNAKWSIIKQACCTAIILLLPCTAMAQKEVITDTLVIIKHDTVWLQSPADGVHVSNIKPTKYDRRMHRYRRSWAALIPTQLKLQYAGNMGLLSAGIGWDYGRRKQWETDLLIGVLPKYESKRVKTTLTVKQNYIPWSLQIKDSPFSIEPLTCGIYFNTVFGHEFWTHEPERYPKGYYGFSSRVRIHIFLGESITYDISPKRRFIAEAVSLFYEISTCDLYLVSAFTNSYLRPRDYLSLSFGIKLQLL